MYKQDELANMVFFDLETASGYENLDILNEENPRMADLWVHRCEYLRSKFDENKDKTDEDLYLDKAALHPEFNRIVCASFGRITFDGLDPAIVIKSYYGADEKEILDGIEKVFIKFNKYNFCGHSIKRFDVPVMCKRLLINGFKLPPYLQIHNKKPWEVPFIDTSELWSFGAWQEGFTSLDLLTAAIGLDSPKEDIKGSDVTKVFWENNDFDRIAHYCERDVYAVAQSLLKLSGLNTMDGFTSSI